MVFSSIIFLFYFLPVFLLGYYVSGWRTGALLTGSVAFYVWGEGGYVLLLAALIVANYAGALWIDRSEAGARRAGVLALAAVDLLVLGYFKYSGFLAHALNGLAHMKLAPELRLALPLGISFFTFQLISYVADVSRGAVRAERDLIRFATYILMFPHLIAGPIVRYADIREEMHADRRRTTRLGPGLQYFIVGLSQKVLVANIVAPVADHVFGVAPKALTAAEAWLGAFAYSLQIYFDFCGYSNMAIGLAFMLGFTYPRNFNYPYAAQSITEFWRRWHISLSSWFRDYLYIPLGGNRAGRWRTVRNLLVVFLLTGLWHGAAWSFIVWGLYHGAFLMLERFGLGRVLAEAPRLLRHVYALLVVGLGWVLFRAEGLHNGVQYLQTMFTPDRVRPPDVGLLVLLNPEVAAALAIGAVLSFPVLPALLDRLRAVRIHGDDIGPVAGVGSVQALDTTRVHALPIALLLTGLVLSVAHLANSTLNPFLYFRF